MSKPHSDSKNKPGRRWREPGFLLPAVEALIIQAAAFMLLYVGCLAVDASAGWQMTLGVAALLQGAVAAIITWWRGLPLWWLPIQFLFPIALLFAHAMALSPLVYFVLFILFVLIYWAPFRTRVPLYLSGRPVWEAVAAFFPEDAAVQFVDIGSGIGGLSLYLADRFPKATVTGIELAPFPWLISWLRARFSGSRAQFIWGDYANVDLAQFDIVFTFLSPAAMPSLWIKALSDMRQDSLLLSYEFIIPGAKPDIVIYPALGGAPLYGWRIPQNF
ncbi:MAG: class I SAM-dependent methyltransferase [Oxalobacter sp.]|nr:MAG: class I SAM-dependent methyltransferase [Oxalobacter sp.]